VLLGGDTKTPIDLSSGKGALEIKKPLIQNHVISIPQFLPYYCTG
jgi:hypothetical protein